MANMKESKSIRLKQTDGTNQRQRKSSIIVDLTGDDDMVDIQNEDVNSTSYSGNSAVPHSTKRERLQEKHKRKISVDFIDLTCTENSMELSLDASRLSMFRRRACMAFQDVRKQEISLQLLTAKVNEHNDDAFCEQEITAALREMADANQVMVSGGNVYLI